MIPDFAPASPDALPLWAVWKGDPLADQAGPYVLTVDGSGKVEQRRVKLGDPHDPDVVVAEGLKAGERVIVEGLQKVRPGQQVQLAAESAKPAGA